MALDRRLVAGSSRPGAKLLRGCFLPKAGVDDLLSRDIYVAQTGLKTMSVR